MSEQINAGIISAFEQGIVRSTSLMPNGRAFDNAISIAREHPGLGVGIHLSLVDEAPVSSAFECFPKSYKALAMLLFTGRFNRANVTTECCSQIEKVLSSGICPTHIDSHQHVHILPVVSSVVVALAMRYGIPVIRIPMDRSGIRLTSRGMQIAISRLLSEKLSGIAIAAGLKTVNQFFGLEESGHITESAVLQAIGQSIRGINELMCHPGFSDPQTSGRYKWGYTWDAEVEALCAEKVLSAVQERGVVMSSFADAWN